MRASRPAAFLAAFLVLAASAAASAQNAPDPAPGWKAGEDYKAVANPVLFRGDGRDGRIELVYLFWYGCPTCRSIDPLVGQWLASLPADVKAVRLPAVFDNHDAWKAHALMFAALDKLGIEEKLHSAVFEAVQKAPSGSSGGHPAPELLTPEAQSAFLEASGVPKADYLAALASPDVQKLVARAASFCASTDLSGVPGMVVDGRWQFVLPAGGPSSFLDLAQKLIDHERSRRRPAGK